MRLLTGWKIFMAVSAMFWAGQAGAAPPTLQLIDLGNLGGSDFEPYDMSADASLVVGYARTGSNAGVGFSWVSPGPATQLTPLAAGSGTSAQAVSADGIVIVGTAQSDAGTYRATRWVNGVPVSLGVQNDQGNGSYSQAVSSDGSVITGFFFDASFRNQVYVWTNGTLTYPALIPGHVRAFPSAISSDGSIIVGTTYTASGSVPFFLTSSGISTVPDSPAGYVNASSSSSDCSVIAGTIDGPSTGNLPQAFRWSQADGYRICRPIPGWTRSQAYACSPDGSLLAGSSYQAGWKDYKATLWDSTTGLTYDLKTLLLEAGLEDAADWEFLYPYAVNGNPTDGFAIAGTGEFDGEQRGFLIKGLIPPPLTFQRMVVQGGSTGQSFVGRVQLEYDISAGLQEIVDSIGSQTPRISLTNTGYDGTGNLGIDLSGKVSVVGTSLVIDFGAEGIGGARNLQAGDGRYLLWVDADNNTFPDEYLNFNRLAGDVNGDHIVNQADQALIQSRIGTTGPDIPADANGDGVVNSTDLLMSRRYRGAEIVDTPS